MKGVLTKFEYIETSDGSAIKFKKYMPNHVILFLYINKDDIAMTLNDLILIESVHYDIYGEFEKIGSGEEKYKDSELKFKYTQIQVTQLDKLKFNE